MMLMRRPTCTCSWLVSHLDSSLWTSLLSLYSNLARHSVCDHGKVQPLSVDICAVFLGILTSSTKTMSPR